MAHSYHLHTSLKHNCSEACSMAKYPNDTSNICTTATAVSRNPTGRTVHLARTRDSFGTRSCGKRTTDPTQEGRAAQRASRPASLNFKSHRLRRRYIVRSFRHTYRKIREEGKSSSRRKSAWDGRKIYMRRERGIRTGEESRDPGMDPNFSDL